MNRAALRVDPARASARRVWGLMYRHLALYRRSWPRLIELMYWPILQMVVWGFVTAYLAGVQNNVASVAASSDGMLTALRITPPPSASATASAISTPTLSCASFVDAPKCGVSVTCGSLRNG